MVEIASSEANRDFVDYQFTKMGFKNAYMTLPVRRFGALLYYHLLENQDPETRDDWVEEMNSPLGTESGHDFPQETVDMIIKSKQAVDEDDARAYLAHMRNLNNIKDPKARQEATLRFNKSRPSNQVEQ